MHGRTSTCILDTQQLAGARDSISDVRERHYAEAKIGKLPEERRVGRTYECFLSGALADFNLWTQKQVWRFSKMHERVQTLLQLRCFWWVTRSGFAVGFPSFRLCGELRPMLRDIGRPLRTGREVSAHPWRGTLFVAVQIH
jgi:hypothetical protein